jgi:NADH:ubiquinone oxidoreductase subunit D
MLNNGALKKIKMYNINFGPQHPSAQGILKVILVLLLVKKHVGLIYRGTEKLIEYKADLHLTLLLFLNILITADNFLQSFLMEKSSLVIINSFFNTLKIPGCLMNYR